MNVVNPYLTKESLTERQKIYENITKLCKNEQYNMNSLCCMLISQVDHKLITSPKNTSESCEFASHCTKHV